MSSWKRPICWLTRHHWLLQEERPTNQKAYYTYFYQCQVCGQWTEHSVYNLDSLKVAPKPKNKDKADE